MVDTEQAIFGLLATAQEHQNLIEDAFKALEREREHLQLERQALKRAVDALETATKGIPSLIQESAKVALSGAVSAADEEMRDSFSKAAVALKGDLNKVRDAAQATVKELESGLNAYIWKTSGAFVAVVGAIVALAVTARVLGLF